MKFLITFFLILSQFRGAKYPIITHDDFYSQALTLARWTCGITPDINSYTPPKFSKFYPSYKWSLIYFYKSCKQDSIGIQVEYYNGNEWALIPDAALLGNSSGIFTKEKVGEIDISYLDTNEKQNFNSFIKIYPEIVGNQKKIFKVIKTK